MIPLAGSKKPKDENQTSCTAGSLAAKNSCSSKEREVQEAQFSKSCCHTHATGVTRITVKYNCGFPNNLFIRGEGIPGLSWEKGAAMKNVKADEWIWETDKPFTKAQFKIVLNDRQYERGDNHPADCGKAVTYTPKF